MKTIKDKEYSFNHTKERLKERYDIDITPDDYTLLCNKIINENDIVQISVEFQKDDTQRVYDLQFARRGDIRVVWSDAKKCITTALPPSETKIEKTT